MDLTHNQAKILGVLVHLNLTTVGHYALDILQKGEKKTEECLTTLPTDSREKKVTLLKLNRQSGHPRLEVMMGLLKKVNCDGKEARKIITNSHEYCATCE